MRKLQVAISTRAYQRQDWSLCEVVHIYTVVARSSEFWLGQRMKTGTGLTAHNWHDSLLVQKASHWWPVRHIVSLHPGHSSQPVAGASLQGHQELVSAASSWLLYVPKVRGGLENIRRHTNLFPAWTFPGVSQSGQDRRVPYPGPWKGTDRLKLTHRMFWLDIT